MARDWCVLRLSYVRSMSDHDGHSIVSLSVSATSGDIVSASHQGCFLWLFVLQFVVYNYKNCTCFTINKMHITSCRCCQLQSVSSEQCRSFIYFTICFMLLWVKSLKFASSEASHEYYRMNFLLYCELKYADVVSCYLSISSLVYMCHIT